MSNGFIYVVDAHVIDKIEENKYPGPKCLWGSPVRLVITKKNLLTLSLFVSTIKCLT
jgi:hypothetical protein